MNRTEADGEQPVLRLTEDDSVGIARRSISAGESVRVDRGTVTAVDDIPYGHKVALIPVDKGATVRKYGQVIGRATRNISAGEHVHVHNLAMAEVARHAPVHADARPPGPAPATGTATFQGIVRPDGRVATRNYIGIMPTVNCSATAARHIADHFTASGELADFEHVDGVVALVHSTGCGMATEGEGFDILRRTLTGYARHPNFAALLVLGLGCEVNQIDALTDSFRRSDGAPVEAMTIQDIGGTRKTVERGIACVRELVRDAEQARRTPVPASELVLGLNCGGSDAWSGTTANPALGVAADRLVGHGGTAVLAETPEIYGAEHLLTARASSTAVADRLLERIAWWERYTAEHGGGMDNNPSPGNKAGGLTTILEKSLGAVAKAGRSPLAGVYEYAEHIDRCGLVFMDTPGYDPVSVTGIIAGGANLVCFTTGRGSAFGAKPVPSLKLATNTDVYRRMSDDMDVNCGAILDGQRDVDELGHEIFELLLETASGRRTTSEELGYGAEEFTPWQVGAVM